jgi:hypothetical protein
MSEFLPGRPDIRGFKNLDSDPPFSRNEAVVQNPQMPTERGPEVTEVKVNTGAPSEIPAEKLPEPSL